jgi:hypothetical protein
MRLEPLTSATATMRFREVGPTPAGTRMDIDIEGDFDPGGRVTGHLVGVDYFTVRPDGVAQLNVHGTATSPDGDIVAFRATGLARLAPDRTASGRLAVTFQTAAERLAWLNGVLGFGVSRADMDTGELRLSFYTLDD